MIELVATCDGKNCTAELRTTEINQNVGLSMFGWSKVTITKSNGEITQQFVLCKQCTKSVLK